MNYLPWIIGGGIALGVGAWAIAVNSRKPMLAPGDKLWVIGDSLGVGLLLPHRLIEEGQAAGVSVAGNPKGGAMTFQWAKKPDLLQPILDFGAHTVLVVLGTNDAAASESYMNRDFPTHVDKLAGRLLAEGLRVVWLAPGTSPGLPHEHTDLVAQTIFDRGAADGFVTLNTNDIRVQYGNKDVHPTPAGYATLAKGIMGRLTTA